MSAGCQRKEVKNDGCGLKQPKQLPRMELPFTGKVDYKKKQIWQRLQEKDQEFGFGYVKSVMPIYIQMGMLSRWNPVFMEDV